MNKIKKWISYLFNKSNQHLKINEMTYNQHIVFACSHGFKCIIAGLCLIAHGVLPAIYQRVGSRLVSELNNSFTAHYNKHDN